MRVLSSPLSISTPRAKGNLKTEQSVSPCLASNGTAPATKLSNRNNPGDLQSMEVSNLRVYSRLFANFTLSRMFAFLKKDIV